MTPDPNFPKMLFHRTKEPVTVRSQQEWDALGPEWATKPFIGMEPEPVGEPEPEGEQPEPDLDPEPEPLEERPARHHTTEPADPKRK